MANNKDAHRLAVILHADVVGSTKLVQRDERRAHERITDTFRRFSSTIQEYGGEVHEIRGDALLAEFARTSDAVCAALAFQQQNSAHNQMLDDDIIPDVRIGIALGEVVIADNTVTGAGVVLAQRIEQLCEPGGVYITEAIREALPSRLPLDNENLGKHDLKGFEKSVRVYAVRLQADTEVPPPEPQQATKRRQTPLVAAAVAVLVVIAVALVWLKPWQPETALASVERMAFPLPEKPSIVVLPFDNLSGDSEQEVFVDGLTGDIIADLTRYPDFFVIARHSSFAYKNKPVTAQQVAEELGVQYLVEGSIQRTAKQFRITAQLIDALTGRHVWADRYEVPLEDAIVARDEVVRSLVSSFPGQIERAESARASRRGIDSLSAHELVYRGWYHWRRFTKADNAEAGRLFAKAVELDPEFDRAYRGLAWFHAHEFEHRWGEDPEVALELALDNARKALSIAPGHYGNYWALGVIHLYLKQFDQALAAYDKALELNPNDASLLAGSTELLLYMGKATEAIEHVKRAMRLNPFHPQWYKAFLAAAYFEDRQYDNAIKTTELLIGLGLPNTHIRLAASYAYLGRMDKASAHAAKVLELEPDFSIQRYAQSRSYKEKSDLEHFMAGLRKAGLPENPPLALPDKPSIAVLPFTNLTGDSEQDYFVDGFTNAIITNLSKFPEFFVIASNSVFTYKGKAVRINEIGRELGVRYILEGSLQRSSNNISVHAQLIEAASEKHLWAESYEGKPEEIFAVQRDLTQQITSTLASKVINLAHTAVLKKDDTSLPAYELYLKGSKYKFGKEWFEESIRLLERAVELDPDFAAAYASLGQRYLQLWRQRLADNPDEALRRARDAIHKAFTLDQQDYRVRLYLANLYQWADKDVDLALAEYEKALALNPNQADVMGMISLNMSFAGRAQEAVDWIEKAKRLNPHHPVWYDWNGSLGYYMARQYDKALLGAKRTLTVYPKSISVLRILAATYVEMGNMEKAREVAQKMLEIDPGFTLSGVRNVPLKRKADRERYFGALAKAGLPE